MSACIKSVLVASALIFSGPALAQTPPDPAPAAAPADWPVAWFEIFKIAPGHHEAFVRDIALGDQVLAAGGQAPTQLFFHDGGADWDILVFKPVPATPPTAAQEAAMEAKKIELGLPTGPAYFIHIREQLASHTDTKTVGPVSAAQWARAWSF